MQNSHICLLQTYVWTGCTHLESHSLDKVPRISILSTEYTIGFSCDSNDKRIHLQCGRPGFHPLVGKILWRRAWQPTPVSLPEESLDKEPGRPHLWGRKESDMTEWLSTGQHSIPVGGNYAHQYITNAVVVFH